MWRSGKTTTEQYICVKSRDARLYKLLAFYSKHHTLHIKYVQTISAFRQTLAWKCFVCDTITVKSGRIRQHISLDHVSHVSCVAWYSNTNLSTLQYNLTLLALFPPPSLFHSIYLYFPFSFFLSPFSYGFCYLQLSVCMLASRSLCLTVDPPFP